MAPQLQLTLKPRLVGIDNGPFVDLAVEPKVAGRGRGGQFRGPRPNGRPDIVGRFWRRSKNFNPGDDKPLWGDVPRFGKEDAPWFVMAGRDDSRQKGYDVLARAAELFLEEAATGGQGAVSLLSDSGRRRTRRAGVPPELAERFPHSVLVFPFLFREGFRGRCAARPTA